MANIASSHNWDDKHNAKSYRPTSLFPILIKIFESLIYHDMYWFYIENNLISLNQSGFKQEDSCINQLLSITHDIYQSLDQGYEVCEAFLDISKAFDEVQHKSLLHELERNGISGALLKILTDFIKSRKQSFSKWSTFVLEWCSCRCSTRKISGPPFLLICINDLFDVLQCNKKLFAYDTSLFATVHKIKQ